MIRFLRKLFKHSENGKNLEESPHPSNFQTSPVNIPNVLETHGKLEELKIMIKEVSNEVSNNTDILKNVENLVTAIPAETVKELENMRKNNPLLYRRIMNEASVKVNASIYSAIDSQLVGILETHGKLSSKQFVDKATEEKVCSDNTFFKHIAGLVERGLIQKLRDRHTVYYTLVKPIIEEKEAVQHNIKIV